MGFFGVLKPDGSLVDFEVVHCHLNLWCLGGILGHRNFFFDVGLRVIVRGDQPLTEFDLALPFGTADDAVTDLSPDLEKQAVLQMVFGRPVDTDHAGNAFRINYTHRGDTPGKFVPVIAVPSSSAERVVTRSGKDFSLWSLKPDLAVPSGSEGYFRMRFHVLDIGRMWRWKRFLWFGKNGAVVDFRVADIRDAFDVPDAHSLLQRMVRISELYAFVIAPAMFQQQAVSPPFYNLRLFEGRAWEEYLGAAAYYRRSTNLVIYQWRRQDIEPARPFRAFLDLNREFGVLTSANHAIGVTAFVAALVILIVVVTGPPEIADVVGLIKALFAAVVAVGLLKVLSLFKMIRSAIDWLRKAFLRLEKGTMRARRFFP